MYIVCNLHNYFPCKKLLKWVLVSLHCEISEPHFIAEHCSKSNENDYQIGIYFRLYHFFFGYSLKYDENEYPIGTSFGLDYTGAVRPCFPNNSTQTRASNNTHQIGLPSLRHMENADAAIYRDSCMDRDMPRNADNIAAIKIIGKEYEKKMDIERYLFEQKKL